MFQVRQASKGFWYISDLVVLCQKYSENMQSSHADRQRGEFILGDHQSVQFLQRTQLDGQVGQTVVDYTQALKKILICQTPCNYGEGWGRKTYVTDLIESVNQSLYFLKCMLIQ